jgi:hypothetical protein
MSAFIRRLVVLTTFGLILVPARSQAFIFDGFNGVQINHDIWHGGEGSDSGTSDTETSRGIQNGQLRMSLTTFGKTDANAGNFGGNTRVRLNSPAGLTILFVQVTVTQAVAQGCPANTTATRPRARIRAAFFNDGSSTGANDETGDIIADLQMVMDSSKGPVFELNVLRCSDAQCNGSTNVGFVTFAKIWALNQPHTLLLFGDQANKQITGIVDFNTAGAETQNVAYGMISDTNAPGLDFKELQVTNLVASCTAGAKMAQITVRFENFFAQ